jgi:hypothetical protein
MADLQPSSPPSVPTTWTPAGTWFRPALTRWRMGLALAVALTADGLQLLLGPIGWAFSDEVIDVVAMALTSGLIGFHVLLLPTFVLELIPVVGMLPTWTACVIAVIALRKRQAAAHHS